MLYVQEATDVQRVSVFTIGLKKKSKNKKPKDNYFIPALSNTRYLQTISSQTGVRYQPFLLDHFLFWCLDSSENAREQIASCCFVIETCTAFWYVNFYPGMR